MHNNKYISTNNYEVIENPNFFDVDEQIAETISILNKKGYKTLFSCAGHNINGCYTVTTDISLLEEAKKDSLIHIGKINENNFEYYHDNEITSTYIKFIQHYNFETLPDGFNYESADDSKKKISEIEISKETVILGDSISKTIYYFENDIRKEDEIIEAEIKETNDILLKWAKKLPSINL
jgi:hypothetical protein